MSSAKGHAIGGGHPMTPPPEAIIRVWAPFAPRFSDRVWRHAQGWLRGAMLAPGAGTGTTALRVMGLSAERRGTHSHRVLNRAVWSARHGSRRRLGRWLTLRVPPAATMVLGADDTVERRSGRQSRATGCDRDAVRASHTQVSRCFGLTWGSMRRLVPVPWRQRGWARPGRTVWCWPANTPPPRRHHPSVAGVRQRRPQGRRGRPGRRWVLVGAGGVAAVSLALAGVKPPVVMAARWRWAAALEPPPAPQPPGTRGPHPPTGKRQRRLPGGRTAPTRPERPWRWRGTAASANGFGASRARPGGRPPSGRRWRFALASGATRRGRCGWRRASVPTSRPRPCRLCRGS